MIIDEVFSHLKAIHKRLTGNEVSKSYLLRFRGYLCSRRNRNKDFSNNVALNLYGARSKKTKQWKVLASMGFVM